MRSLFCLTKHKKTQFILDLPVPSPPFCPRLKLRRVNNTKNGNQISVGHFWEVLSLGSNSWRRIKDVPPIPDGLTSSAVYVNGSIYWFPENFESGIVAFDVGSEKFGKIQIPQVIVDRFGYYYYLLPGCVRLQEVKGCLAISCSYKYAVELWIHEANNKGTGDESWNKQIITLPGCVYKSLLPTFSFVHFIAGTGQLILEIHQTDTSGSGVKKCMSLFSYNWQDETFEKMKISGISSSATVCTSFVESLISFPEAEMKQPNQPSTSNDY